MKALDEETELDFSNTDLSPREVVRIAVVIKACRSKVLTKLDLSTNNIATAEGYATAEAGIAIGEALEGTPGLKELNVSGRGNFGSIYVPGFIRGICKGLLGNEALTSLNLSSNYIQAEGAKAATEAIKVTVRLRLYWQRFHAHLTAGQTVHRIIGH
jgi:hypothetical protein